MDAYLAIVSRREVRDYDQRPIPEATLRQILQAGRASGSSKNSQPWRFIVLRDAARRRALAKCMRDGGNLERCVAAIAVILLNEVLRFDAGRVSQNLMVAAWSFGIGSCPNSVHPDRAEQARTLLLVPDDAAIASVITLGFPAPGQPHPKPGADPERVLERIDRLPLEQLASDERFTR